MGKWLLLLFVLVPIVEAVLLAQIGAALGWLSTIALIVTTGVVGAWLSRREGTRAWRRWQMALARGEMPDEGLLTGVLLLLGCALLVTPGVVTDAAGLALVFGPSRRSVARWLTPRLERRFGVGAGTFTSPDAFVSQRLHVVDFGVGDAPGAEHRWADESDARVIDADFEVKTREG